MPAFQELCKSLGYPPEPSASTSAGMHNSCYYTFVNVKRLIIIDQTVSEKSL